MEQEREDYSASDSLVPGDFYDAEVAMDEVQKVTSRNRIPGGLYQTDPEELGEFQATPTQYEDGRQSVRFFGKARREVRSGEALVTSLRFTISAQARQRRNAEGEMIEGKDDAATCRYAEAVGVYAEVRGAAPKTVRDVVEFLQHDRYGLLTFPGREGLVVSKIVAPKKGR